ncbi:MAG: PspC domain-containing protein [Aeromicrobium erythreum]
MTTDRLTRSRGDRWIAGVCGGLARRYGWDPTLVRAVVAVATLLGLGSLVLVYLVLWIVTPQEDPWATAGTTGTVPGPASAGPPPPPSA